MSAQNPETEKRLAMLALDLSIAVATTVQAHALKWNNGSGVHAGSSARRVVTSRY
jgi:hypothetical protein